MKKLTLLCVVAMLCLILTSLKDNKLWKEGLTGPSKRSYINDRLPDNMINNILNYPISSATPRQLQAGNTKLLLLDFWFTNCAPCVRQIPKLDSLQQQFKDQLQIVMVTFENEKIVKPFIDHWEQKQGRKLSLPVVTADTLLQQFFAQGSRPNYAWIATDQTYMGHTSTAFLTAQTIESVLKEMQKEVHNRGHLYKKQ